MDILTAMAGHMPAVENIVKKIMRRPQLVRQTFLVLVRIFASQIGGGKFTELEQGLPPPFN